MTEIEILAQRVAELEASTQALQAQVAFLPPLTKEQAIEITGASVALLLACFTGWAIRKALD